MPKDVPSNPSLVRAGGTLLLVGSILQMVMGLVMFLWFLFVSRVLADANVPGVSAMVWVMAAAGVLSIVGGEIGLRAYRHARRNDLHGAFVRGLVASMLPPVAVVTLIGAILCEVGRGDEPATTGAPTQ